MRSVPIVVFVALCFVASNAVGQIYGINRDQNVDAIVAQQKRIRAEVEAATNGWEDVSPEQRNDVLRNQNQLFLLLEGTHVIGDLPADRQVEASNLLEKINAAVTGRADDRKICTRERKVGSNFTQRVCRTVGDIRREREAVHDGLDRGGVCAD